MQKTMLDVLKRNLLDQLKQRLAVDGVQPTWNPLSPLCSRACPSHDGKRCEKLGHRPSNHCDVAVAAMGKLLSETTTPRLRVAGNEVQVHIKLASAEEDDGEVVATYDVMPELEIWTVCPVATWETDAGKREMARQAQQQAQAEFTELMRARTRDYAALIEHHLGEVLQEVGLWDGRDETKEAAAWSAAGRVVIETHAERPLEVVIVFDGKPARKVSMMVKP